MTFYFKNIKKESNNLKILNLQYIETNEFGNGGELEWLKYQIKRKIANFIQVTVIDYNRYNITFSLET